MAGKRIDFSHVLDDIRAPVGPDGNLLVRAGHTAGHAHELSGHAEGVASRGAAAAADTRAKGEAAKTIADANALAFLGTTGVAAVKGKMESDLSSEIKDTISNLDTGSFQGDAAKARRDQFGGLADAAVRGVGALEAERAEMDNFDFGEGGRGVGVNQEIGAFRQEAARYVNAMQQGNIGREEAIARIAASVKKYSAMLPGFASDFRKVGAELTGISNIDVHGVHTALTQKSMAEKAREKHMEIEMQLQKEAASALGLSSLSQLSPQALAFYRTSKIVGLQTAQLENQRKVETIEQDRADQVGSQLASAYIGQTVAGLAAKSAQLHAAHLTSDNPDKQANALKLGAQVAAEIDVAEKNLIEQVTRLGQGKNAISGPALNKLIGDIRPMFQNFKEGVKTAEGFNLWGQIVKASEGNANHLLNMIKLANPHMEALRHLGVAPELAKAWIALGGDYKKFSTSFGKPAADAMQIAMNNPQSYAGAFTRVATGQATVVDEIKHDPQLGKVVYNDVVNAITDKVRNQGGVLRNDQEKMSFSNMIHSWTHHDDWTKPEEFKKAREVLLSPNFSKLVEQLDPAQRTHALTPLVHKINTMVPNAIGEIRELQDKWKNNSMVKEWGHELSIKYDPLAQRINVETKLGTKAKDSAAPAGYGRLSGGASLVAVNNFDMEMRDAVNTIKQRVELLNVAPKVMAQMVPAMNPDLKPTVWSLFAEVMEGLRTGNRAPLFTGESNVGERHVPKNSPQASVSPADFPKESTSEEHQRALRAAELLKSEGVSEKDVKEIETAIAALKGSSARGASEARQMLEQQLRLHKLALTL